MAVYMSPGVKYKCLCKWTLKQHLHRISMIDNPTCDYGTDHEPPEHTIFHCQNNAVLREILIDNVELSFVASQTPIQDSH